MWRGAESGPVPEGFPAEVIIRRTSRARRLSLRVSSIDGRTTLSAPKRTSDREIRKFLSAHADWVRNALPDVGPKAVALGSVLPVEGQPVEIAPAPGGFRAIKLTGGQLLVPQQSKDPARAVLAFLKTLARDRLVEEAEGYAGRLGRKVAGITLRDTRSRWGSCTAAGRLNFSWRLIMAPPDVRRYVAAHEAAHLVEMNHSSAFWALVAELEPDYQAPRHWLKEHGRTLLSYRFGD